MPSQTAYRSSALQHINYLIRNRSSYFNSIRGAVATSGIQELFAKALHSPGLPHLVFLAHINQGR